MRNVGLGDLEPTKGYHFPQGYDFVLLYCLNPGLKSAGIYSFFSSASAIGFLRYAI